VPPETFPYVVRRVPIEIFDTIYFLSAGEAIFVGTLIACAIVALFVSIKR
jgi:hypothetical protein